jgi:transglutaminase-like putative cysteine protease
MRYSICSLRQVNTAFLFRQKLLLSTFYTIIVLAQQLSAQDRPIKWGEVPQADLKMKSYPADSNATAVILCDYGEVSFDDDFNLVFTRHRRVKILSEAGYDWGEVSLPYYAKERVQWLDGVEGHTLTLANGGVRKDKLDKKSIFNEDVDGEWRRVRFTLPNLAPGAVIEYRYQVHSQSARYLEGWEFQSKEPTLWSEFRAEIPSALQYVSVRQGLSSLDLNETKELLWPPTWKYYQTARAYNLKIVGHRWVKRNLPALREEPFMTTREDYLAKISFQLARVKWPEEAPREYMTSWEKLAEELLAHESFGGQIDRHKVLREQAQTLVAGIASPEQKLRAIYDYVRATMTWNEKRGIYVDEPLDKMYQARRGDGPGIALMLTGMLRAAGLEAHPVLISTRNNGKVIELYPLLTQFNHVLTYAKIGAKEYLLDATDPLRPYDLLPEAALNHLGWLAEKKAPRWVNIPASGVFQNHTTVFAELSAEGVMTGHFESLDAGYSGLFDRRTLREGKKEEDYIREGWLKQLVGAQLDSFKISQRDSVATPLLTKAHFSSTDHAQVAGDNIYFMPMLFGRREDNPFKRPERAFPVDFAYPRKLIYTANIVLPEGYIVEETPRNLVLEVPNQGVQFRRSCAVEGNTLQFMTQTHVRKVRFEPQEYKALRELYDRIVAAHAEQVVLARDPAAATKKGE